MSATANKAKGRRYERVVAERIGGERWPANTGGPEDVRHDWLSVQVKSGARLMTAEVRAGVASARAAAAGSTKLPVCYVAHCEAGLPTRLYVVIEAGDFEAWSGLHGPPARDPVVEPVGSPRTVATGATRVSRGRRKGAPVYCRCGHLELAHGGPRGCAGTKAIRMTRGDEKATALVRCGCGAFEQ